MARWTCLLLQHQRTAIISSIGCYVANVGFQRLVRLSHEYHFAFRLSYQWPDSFVQLLKLLWTVLLYLWFDCARFSGATALGALVVLVIRVGLSHSALLRTMRMFCFWPALFVRIFNAKAQV